MAIYKCPSKTCNVVLTGSIAEIVNPAIWHAQGSHGLNINEEYVAQIIEMQAQGKSIDYLVDENTKKVDLAKWWRKINL